MRNLRYGVTYSFTMPVVLSGSDDLAASNEWTPELGDVKVSLDSGVAVNIGTLPTFISGANVLRWTLSDIEMEASEIAIIVVDSAVKTIKDTVFTLTTEAHDRPIVTLSGAPTMTSMDTDLTDASGIHDDSILKILKSATLKGAQAFILSSSATNGTLTFEAGRFPLAPTAGDIAIIINK